ncbi:MAG: 30S ribosome-binding factor RbfA [Chitinispirillaceae bacterium]|nr:30S ribosome-binding factor RbfA [Chitinispirillaceae bacterium]
MASPHFHKERLAEVLRREIVAVISRELRDPRVPPIVTITGINLAPDTRNATVFVSIFDDKRKAADAVEALNNAAPFIQRLVASRITVKHFPRLYFKYDDTMEHVEHIHQLLKEIHDAVG